MKKATGKVIKAFRKHLGCTQEFVASKLNITTATLANIENGRAGLDLEKLYLLSKVLGLPARIILDLSIEIFENGNEEKLTGIVKQLKNLPLSSFKD